MRQRCSGEPQRSQSPQRICISLWSLRSLWFADPSASNLLVRQQTSRSASPIDSVTERTDQEGDMIVLGRVVHRKDDTCRRKECVCASLFAVVDRQIEREPIRARHWFPALHERAQPAILTGGSRPDRPPGIALLEFENHRYAGRRSAVRQIEY